MKPKKILLLLGVLFIVQLALPLWLVVSNEVRSSVGAVFHFKVEPVDPLDLFSGRYAELRLACLNDLKYDPFKSEPREMGSWVFAVLERDADGFSRIKEIVLQRPRGDFLELKAGRYGYLVNPFTRYYMNQKKAPKVDEAIRSRGLAAEASIAVRIRNGRGTVIGLYLDGVRAESWVEGDRVRTEFEDK